MSLVLLSGAIAGFLHALSGPDHLAAVAPLAIGDKQRGWFAGWTWGFGHATGVVSVAALAVLFRNWLPSIDVLSIWGERLVGVALIGVGLWAVRRGVALGASAHHHGTHVHSHLHIRRGPAWFRRLSHAHASFYMGILHGIAGSSHFFGVLPALALPTATAGLAYVLSFGVGTVVAMTAFAAAVAASARFGGQAGLQRGLMITSGVVALLVGSVWVAS